MINNLVTYKKLIRTDILMLAELVKIYAEVFEMEKFSVSDNAYLETLLADENIVFFVAIADNSVVGGLTAYILPSVYYPSGQVYIYDLAVKQNRQRQGIGKEIISALKNYCREAGHKEMYVQADIDDQHAVEFYRATGGHAEKVIHFSYDLTEPK